ncbi:MAG: hypothetical protein ACRYG5_13325 [Janthinobacterium lividum]
MMNVGAVNASSPIFSRRAGPASVDPEAAAMALVPLGVVPGRFHASDEQAFDRLQGRDNDDRLMVGLQRRFAARGAQGADASGLNAGTTDETVCNGLLGDVVPLCAEASELPSIMPDVDELVHGLYAFYVKLHALDQTGSSGFLAEGIDESARLAADPLKALRSPDSAHPQPVGTVDVLANSLTCVGAAMAIVGGCREMRDARALERNVRAALDRTHAALQQNAEQRLLTSPARRLAQGWLERSAADLQRARRANRWNMRIGVGSFGSGLSLVGKAGLELGTQVGLTVAAKGAAIGAFLAANKVAALAAVVTGGACALVLGPLAGVFAAVMGVAFLSQSSQELRNWRSDRRLLQMLSRGRAPTERGRYGRFLAVKLAARAKFLKIFHRGNRVFACSASLYAASVVAKGLVWATALAFGVAASPLLLNVLLYGGLCGGLMMGVASLQFLYKHPQHKRYATYATESDPHIQRDVIAAVELMNRQLCASALAPSARRTANTSSSALTQSCFEMFERKEAARQHLLAEAAASCDKHYVPRRRSEEKLTDSAEPADGSAGRRARFAHDAGVLARAAGTLLMGRGVGAARDVWGAQRAGLSELVFREWLDAPAALTAQCDYMKACLSAQAEHFERLWRVLQHLEVVSHAALDGLASKSLDALSDVDRADPLVRLRLNQLKIEATMCASAVLLADLTKLGDMAANHAGDAPEVARSLKSCRERFVALQEQMVGEHPADIADGVDALATDAADWAEASGQAATDLNANAYVRQTVEKLHQDGVTRDFAELCVRREKRRWTRVRGILPEVELQAARWAARAPA